MNKKRVLITGSSGFVGRWLLRALQTSNGWAAVPLDESVDLRDASRLHEAIRKVGPDAVIHLAGQSYVPDAFKEPRLTLEVNLLGTLNLLEGLRANRFCGRLILASSADVYGSVPAEAQPIPETRATDPRNPYAVSKVSAEALCTQWSHSEGLDAVILRSFNLIGPGQSSRFFVANMAEQFALMARGRQPARLVAGNLEVARDFTDVRDAVRAYVAVLDSACRSSVYNVCSARATKLRRIVDCLAGISGVQAEISIDAARLRPAEPLEVVGDNRRIVAETGWRPEHDLETTLRDLYRACEGSV